MQMSKGPDSMVGEGEFNRKERLALLCGALRNGRLISALPLMVQADRV